MKRFLYDILADNWLNKNGSIKIYSDPHFGDMQSYRIRHLVNIPDKKDYFNKFKDGDIFETYETFVSREVTKADLQQIKNINKEIGKNDTIIFLGDIGDVECIKKIRGYKILIMGNHDKGASNYKRIEKFEEVEVEKYLNGKTPNELCVELSDEEQEKYYHEARNKAEKEYRNKENFVRMSDRINYDFKSPFMSWTAYFDNKLFDEVYEGPLMINDRVILSHEPIAVPEYMYNIHGHVHNKDYKGDSHHLNACAESINYKPIDILSLFKKGLLKDIDTIHRETIDKAIDRKEKKEGNKNGKKVK